MGTSKERDGFSGKYTEHFDDAGRKIGESRKRQGWFGEYTEHTDTGGRKAGESRERDGWFGRYTEHTDRSGRRTGESRQREGWFGNYTEHTDRRGRKTGESRRREGLFGDYSEHTGSNNYLPSSERPPGFISSLLLDGVVGGFAGVATRIGAVLGGLVGLGNAFEHSYSAFGYVLSLAVGAVVGGVVGSLFVYALAFGIGLLLIALVLRACGANVPLPF